ncbi:MAG: septal ring lytic transglycosylase RlpA family protein [Alphaproteobacteria bacterium]|nr:septal ring lytic transglycosylase RlpA family protein [Alphaproteobacteria bacterium]OJV15800.1 MAG: hypothetical protein BGO27_07795 [Alphaproteobacteria bacterium 33-17]
MSIKLRAVFLSLLVVITGCRQHVQDTTEHDYGYINQPYDGHYKIGEPYKIKDKWYYPEVNEKYVEEGVASWYGTSFHGSKTANGDQYNKKSLTAAHRTLPLPSMVRVTNMENGHSVIVMINDRGPFANDRIIDVSERAAELLDFKKKGTGNVRVEYLPKQTADLRSVLGLSQASSKVQATGASVKDTELEEVMTENCDANCGAYYVQVGAYKNKVTAKKLAAKFAKLGGIEVNQITKADVKLHRVRIGPFENETKAKKIVAKVKELGSYKAIVTQD